MTDSDVSKQTGLSLRKGIYYVRVVVPLDLQAAYGGRTTISRTLDTRDLREAKLRAAERRAEFLRDFNDKRRELSPQPVAVITPELGATLVAGIRAMILSADDNMRDFPEAAIGLLAREGDPEAWAKVWGPLQPVTLDGRTPKELSALARHNQQALETANAAWKSRDLRVAAMWADAEARSLGLRIDWNAPEARPILVDVLKAVRQAWLDVASRDSGDVIETPQRPAPVPVAAPTQSKEPARPTTGASPAETTAETLKLRDVYDLWAVHERDRPAKTLQVAQLALSDFEARTGNPPLASLTKAMGAQFRAALMESKLSDKTAAGRLSWVQILLNFEVSQYGRLAVNPWRGLSITVKKTARTREEWTDADAAKLFAAPLFQRYELPTTANAGKDAAYWLPILGAFTGARLTELAQLLVVDIEGEGASRFIRIAKTKDWQSLKSDASWRTIPMHSELVRLGFGDYVDAMRERGAERLFPAVAVSALNNAGGAPGSWFSKLKIGMGFGAGHTFHGWRNTVETKLQLQREGQLFIDRYVGHKPSGGEGPETYARIRPADLIATAEKITYPGLNLPRVFTAPAWTPED